jgi:eukaryotic-like serine/threonine-protein kinase
MLTAGRTLRDATLEQPVLEVGVVVGARYEVECLLGSGTFAQVYRARDLVVPDHTVSLKISRDPATEAQAVASAMRELQLIASVFHPSIVQLKDHGWHENRLWFVMPLYRGETLATRLARSPLSRRAAREIFEVLAEALATLHRAGVRHQDIKPDNIFLAQVDPDAERRLPVLIDLGLAVKDAELVLAGTPTYLAPEVAARFAGVPDPAPIGPKADVFALALTLRQALDTSSPEDAVGEEGVDAFVSARARVAPRAPARRDLRDLRASFERWLNISPDVRPTAEEFRRELRILTLKDERRARRLALARWLAPTALAIVALFATTAMVLTREAEVQRIEARHERVRASAAQARAVTMHTNLEEEKGRRRVVENEFRNSRATCSELEQRLIRAEQEIARQQKAADDMAAELCRIQNKGVECKPPIPAPLSSVSVVPGQPPP